MTRVRPLVAVVAALVGLLASPARTQPGPQRRVAVTFDDLPGAPAAAVSNGMGALAQQTFRLLEHVKTHAVPVTAFVNEGKLHVEGETPDHVALRAGLLNIWAAAGVELGNHTYSHNSLNRESLVDFQADVLKGETSARRLMELVGKPFRYFRHPFLQVGLDLEKRRAFEAWLATKGYTVAPVSMDNDEYMFAAIYAQALRKNRADEAARIADAYVAYMASTFAFFERVEQQVLGRPLSHVLLLHANALNADHFGRIATTLRDRGYRFISLAEALEDEAWRRPDTYVGNWGISWLHHWEITETGRRSPSPDPPAWVVTAYDASIAAVQ